MNKSSRVFVAGHRGLVGSALVRELETKGHTRILTVPKDALDLRDFEATLQWFKDLKPEYVFLAAAKVGGISANNSQPVDFLVDNLAIALNVVRAASVVETQKLMFLGSSCIYPKLCPQPIKEEYLLSGPLEPTNQWYAVAKIAGLKLCQAFRKQHGRNFIAVMPTNLYGPCDRYGEGCHVIPNLIERFHDAKAGFGPVTVWGSGETRREFLYSDDLANACVLLMDKYDGEEPVNIGYGTDMALQDLAYAVADTVGLKRERLVWDPNAPIGTPRKWLDSTQVMGLGWKPEVTLEGGLKVAYADYLNRFRPCPG